MAAAQRFEDLLVWQKSRQLANAIYKLTAQPSFKDSSLRNQMRRAAVSVMSNVAEGFGRGSNEEFLRFLFIAKGSATEVLSQLYLASDLGYISQDQFQAARKLGDQSAAMIQSFAKSLKGAGRGSFRHRRQQIPWRERVDQVMKEISEGSRDKEPGGEG